jgi:hypothetical protein
VVDSSPFNSFSSSSSTNEYDNPVASVYFRGLFAQYAYLFSFGIYFPFPLRKNARINNKRQYVITKMRNFSWDKEPPRKTTMQELAMKISTTNKI